MNPKLPPEDNVELEAIAQNGLQTNESLDDIKAASEATAVTSAKSGDTLKEIEGNQEHQLVQAADTLKAMKPTLEAQAKMANIFSSLMTNLEGPTGPQGEKGDSVTGPQGPAGKDSIVPGPKGDKGDTGPAGPEGKASTVAGPKGEDSNVPGPVGPAGKDGKNADIKKVTETIIKKVQKKSDKRDEENISRISRHVASKSYSTGDLTDTQDASTGQVMIKQADGSWEPSTVSGSGDMTQAVYDPTGVADDAFARANHTGTQAISTVTGLQTELDSAVKTVVAGTNVTVDATDPENPIVSSTGGGAVDSVNTQTGVVVLDTDDIDDSTQTNKYTTAGDISKLAGIEAGAEVNEVTLAGAETLTNKTLDADNNTITNIGAAEFDTDTMDMFGIIDGLFFEKVDFTIVDDSGLQFDVEALGGGDLHAWIGGEKTTLDCTTGAGVGGTARVALTEGSDANTPAANYITMTNAGSGVGALQATSSIPTGAFGWIGYAYVPDATTWATTGAYSLQRTTESFLNDSRGALSHEREKIRSLGATYTSGIGSTLAITTNGGSADNVHLQSAAGIVKQMHPQTFPAFTTGPYYHGNGLTPFARETDLNAFLTEVDGDSLSGKRFNLIIVGAVNKTTGECKWFVNKPLGSYGKDADAISDKDNKSDYSVPAALKGTAFMGFRVALRHTTADNGTWEELGLYSLLGNPLGGQTGGSGAVASNEFDDLLFRLYNTVDPTKEIDFDISGVTTGTTRTITMPDADVDLADVNSALQNVSEDTTPQLGGELDSQANSIGFTMQTATGDGTTTVDWGNGNHMDFTFGAFNETFTFTAPAKSGVYTMSLKQDGTGSRTATWPATVKWAGGTAPTLTTTATTGYDVVSFRYDGSNYYAVASLDFS